MRTLAGKRILFIAPAFFGYENKIADKMRELGAVVDSYDERSITKSYERALLKISPSFFSLKTTKYYNNIINKNRNKIYDYVFVIKCDMLSVSIIHKLRDTYPNAVFCLYLYDSIRNIKGIKNKIKEFDRVLTFDLNDAIVYNMQFRPLFYLDCYMKEIKDVYEYKYDISFIGTIHSDRYNIIKNVKQFLDDSKMKYYFYCYLHSKFSYFFYKIIKKEFRNSAVENFKFQKISSLEISKIIDDTRIVLDIQHPKQSGLTIRTIEMLGMNKKLITTNQNIKEYDFYNPENILIIDRENIVISSDFLTSSYQIIADDIYKKYSIEQWIDDILG